MNADLARQGGVREPSGLVDNGRALVDSRLCLWTEPKQRRRSPRGPPRGQAARTRRGPESWSRRDRVAEPVDQLHFELNRTKRLKLDAIMSTRRCSTSGH